MTYPGDSHVQVVKMFGNSGSKTYPTCWLMKCNHWSSFIPWSRAIPRRFDRLARTDISMMWCKLCIATSSRTISCCAGVHSLSHQVYSFKQFQFHNLFASRICFCFSIFPIGKYHLNKFTKDKIFVILRAWVVKFCQIIQAESSVDQVGTAWQSSFATLERQGANNQGWLPHRNWKATQYQVGM